MAPSLDATFTNVDWSALRNISIDEEALNRLLDGKDVEPAELITPATRTGFPTVDALIGLLVTLFVIYVGLHHELGSEGRTWVQSAIWSTGAALTVALRAERRAHRDAA